MSLDNVYAQLNAVKGSIDKEFLAEINVKNAEIKASADREAHDRFVRELNDLQRFTVLTEDSPNLPGMSNAQVMASVQGNNHQAAVTLALIDYFRQHPNSTGMDLADLGISIPMGLNISTIKNVAQASLIYDKLNAARPRLSIGIMALSGKV